MDEQEPQPMTVQCPTCLHVWTENEGTVLFTALPGKAARVDTLAGVYCPSCNHYYEPGEELGRITKQLDVQVAGGEE